ncbi:uncharacterized protein [Elaeis guineensis]|uniref:Uncharacterized protein LOC105055826 isoform X2 n=1 Tax=Elaeis guineensis var. tenera TaxID=51953 RepID=A0A8N4F2U0_ELAGV|nr:uncharacterized protein LOC105055826 isoform X2 [Elaeis guineensis]
MGHKADSANVGCKVLPICDAVSTGSNGGDSSDGSEKDVQKGERRRAVSQMKELLKWAAAARSHKCGSKGWKVLYFRNRVRHPSVKGGCSSSSSMNSSLSLASISGNDRTLVKNSSNHSGNLRSSECDANMLASPKSEEYVRPGRWITTDSDFVVLEL